MFLGNHWLRLQLEQFLKLVGHLEDVQRAQAWPDAANEVPEMTLAPPDVTPVAPTLVLVPGHYDLRARGHGLPELPANKRAPSRKDPPWSRKPEDIDTLCFHQMAVAFGVSKGRVKFWIGVAHKLPPELLLAYHVTDLNDPAQLKAFGQRIALHERMCKIPYHVAGLLNGDVVHINPLLWYTYHGNGANKRSLGVAADGHYPGLLSGRKAKHNDLDEFMIMTVRHAATVAMTKAQAAGIKIRYADAHRVYSGGRVGDPGEELWQHVVLWAVKEFGLAIRYDRKRGSGRPVPINWDADAHYNYKGRKLKALKEAA